MHASAVRWFRHGGHGRRDTNLRASHFARAAAALCAAASGGELVAGDTRNFLCVSLSEVTQPPIVSNRGF